MENKPWVEALAERCQPGPGEVTVPASFTWEREAKGGAAAPAKPNSLGKETEELSKPQAPQLLSSAGRSPGEVPESSRDTVAEGTAIQVPIESATAGPDDLKGHRGIQEEGRAMLRGWAWWVW